MSNRPSRFKRQRGRLSEELYPDYPVVSSQTADQLWKRLVADGVARRATPVSWLARACVEIARQKHTSPETVFCDLQDHVRGETGLPLTLEPGRL